MKEKEESLILPKILCHCKKCQRETYHLPCGLFAITVACVECGLVRNVSKVKLKEWLAVCNAV